MSIMDGSDVSQRYMRRDGHATAVRSSGMYPVVEIDPHLDHICPVRPTPQPDRRGQRSTTTPGSQSGRPNLAGSAWRRGETLRKAARSMPPTACRTPESPRTTVRPTTGLRGQPRASAGSRPSQAPMLGRCRRPNGQHDSAAARRVCARRRKASMSHQTASWPVVVTACCRRQAPTSAGRRCSGTFP